MKSMTGFGKSEIETDLGKIIVETKSENHRFLDINFQLPETAYSIENQLLEIVKKHIGRGKVKISVLSENLKTKVPTLNLELAKLSYGTIDNLKRELSINDPTKLEHILMLKDFFSYEAKPSISSKHFAGIKAALSKAINKLDEDRIAEGKKIEKDLKQRMDKIVKILHKIKEKRENFTKSYADNLKERVNKLLDDKQIDESRLYQELALVAERTDITEELVRLDAHINKLKETIEKEDSIGRECDFILQEMNREAGTISAKSKDASISHCIIDFRSEIEKIREQIQNIE